MQDSSATEKDMPRDLGPEQLKLKRVGIRVRSRRGLTVRVWKNRREVYMLTNMDPTPAEGNFCDNSSLPVKPHIVGWYIRHMGYVNISDRMAYSYSMSQRTFKWMTKLFFHLLDLTLLNSWILLSPCGAKYTHQGFRLLVRNLIEEAGKSQNRPTPRLVGRPSAGTKMFCNSSVAITNNGQQNRQPNCTAVCVLLVAKERAQRISASDVMWACAWCLVSRNITQK